MTQLDLAERMGSSAPLARAVYDEDRANLPDGADKLARRISVLVTRAAVAPHSEA